MFMFMFILSQVHSLRQMQLTATAMMVFACTRVDGVVSGVDMMLAVGIDVLGANGYTLKETYKFAGFFGMKETNVVSTEVERCCESS